ncbi:MAG: hypothetical protein C4560_12420 [Nitrospiraceae bacterium]|nr:MAG: hypothetical protein C4560_12420 [Nitrospiraceae bacterium]
MSSLSLKELKPFAAGIVKPFLEDVLSKYGDGIHSVHITGTSITDDFNEKTSDVNSVIVLKEMDIKFLDLLSVLGKKYGKHRVAAPLIMTPQYIRTSLDVFPVEFLNFKLIHSTVYGEDIFKGLEINRMDLRRQCERELKVKLISLRQGYISSLGDRKILAEGLAKSITDYMPLFRGIIILSGKQPPVRQDEVINSLSEAADINTGVFAQALGLKRDKIKLPLNELHTIFENYYAATEKLERIIDAIKA